MRVDLPAPGRAGEPDAHGAAGGGQQLVEQLAGLLRGGPAGVDSTSVMAWASARRSPARTPSASAPSVTRGADCCAEQLEDRGRRRRGCCVPGPKTATTPASCRNAWSCGGITPPHTTRMSSAPALASSSMSCGTSVLWPAAWLDTPTTCTSFSTAARATSAGVSNSGPKSTSKPRSANAVPTTLAPRSWPSWPILAIEDARAPAVVGLAKASTSATDLVEALVALEGRAVHAGDATDLRLVAAEHRLHGVAHLADRGPGPGRLDAEGEEVAVAGGALAEPLERVLRRRPRRGSARTVSRRATCCSRTLVLSMSSTSTWSGSAERYLLTPTMTSSPRSTRACRRAAASSMRSFGMPESTALVMPPSASTSSMIAQARSARCLGEGLHVVAAAERVDDLRDAGLLLDDELRVAGDAGREVGGEAERLVEGVGVQALRAAEHRGHRLDRWCARRCCTGPAR